VTLGITNLLPTQLLKIMYVDGRALPYLNVLVLMGFYLIHTLHFHKCHPMFSVEMDLRTDDCANRVLVSVTKAPGEKIRPFFIGYASENFY
jgi:hypothetical protein